MKGKCPPCLFGLQHGMMKITNCVFSEETQLNEKNKLKAIYFVCWKQFPLSIRLIKRNGKGIPSYEKMDHSAAAYSSAVARYS